MHQTATALRTHAHRHEIRDQCKEEAALKSLNRTLHHITQPNCVGSCHIEGCSEERQALQAQAKVA
jgi:hypothetical protein